MGSGCSAGGVESGRRGEEERKGEKTTLTGGGVVSVRGRLRRMASTELSADRWALACGAWEVGARGHSPVSLGSGKHCAELLQLPGGDNGSGRGGTHAACTSMRRRHCARALRPTGGDRIVREEEAWSLELLG